MQKWQKEFEQFRIATENYLRTTVEELLYQPIPGLSMEKFVLFEKTGNRMLYEQEYFAKRKFLTVFGVAALWMMQEKRETMGECTVVEVCSKLEETLLSVCEEECWALPAHVDRTGNPDWRNTIDLFAAETAQTLLDIVDAVGDKLSTDCCQQVEEQVRKRVLQPFFESAPGTYGWENCDNNWNAVCNGCIGSAYLHSLSKGEAPSGQYLQRICDNLLHYLDGFAEDGTCMEGLGYYFYGMTYFVNFAQELFAITQGKADLLYGAWGKFVARDIKNASSTDAVLTDKRMRIAKWWSKCYFDSGLTVSFSDGSSREKNRMGLACILAQQFKDIQLPPIGQAAMLEEDACYRYLPFKLDVFATRKYWEMLLQEEEKSSVDLVENIVKAEETGIAHILPVAQWCIAQTGKTMEEIPVVGFACKGGHNGESHNHNDVGSFLYVAGEDVFLADLGAGEYTKEYFGSGRYDILCNRSMGHNVPLVNGGEQFAGAEYGCKEFDAEEDEKCVKVSMNLEDAYAQKTLKKLHRSIVFQKESGVCVLTDEFESNEEIIITENLVTQIKPQCKGTEVWLEGRKEICRIKIKPAHEPKIITMEHSNHQGEKEQVYLIQWDVVVKEKAQSQIHISV